MYCVDDAEDLLTRMLTIDPETRITAEEALMHPYFDEIRDEDERPFKAREWRRKENVFAEGDLLHK
jgi:serine/threonine protein kinase